MTVALTRQTPGDFFLEHGRLPRIGDPIPPWHFRGWLLAYIIELHEQLGRMGWGDRWGYHLSIRESMNLPDHPPPEIVFDRHAAHSAAALKNVEKCIDICFHGCGSWSAFNELLRWLAWGCGFSYDFPQLSEKTQEQLYRTYDAKPALLAPYDYLGQLMSEYKGKGWANRNGFYPTPHEVVELMSRMTIANDDWRELLTQIVCDPCVGTGRMLLHASNFSLRLHGNDIDMMCVLATKINGCLYAPWLTFPLPDSLFANAPESEPIILTYDERPKYQNQAVLFG